MNTYQAMKKRHQEEVNAFPMAFAFNDKQFAEGMKKLGLNPEDTDKIYSLTGTGGFYRRTDAINFHAMLDRHHDELQAAIDSDLTGEGFIFDMFNYELANHEYSYTGDISSTLEALNLTEDEVNNNKRLRHGLNLAIKAQQKGGF